MNADTVAAVPEVAAEHYTFHQFSQARGDGGIWAELRFVRQPVTTHRHDFYEIAFALAGSGQHEDQNGRLPILLGDVWIVRPGQWHAFPLVGNALRVFNLLLTPRFGAACLALLPPRGPRLLAAPDDAQAPAVGPSSPLAVRHIRLSAQGLERIRPLLLTLAAEVSAPDTSGQACLCAGLVLQVLGLLDRCGTSEAHQSAGALAAHDDAGLLAAVRYIDEQYAEPLTLRDLARQSGYVPTYLAHKFRKRLGVPPMDYLFQVRLQHACALLETTVLSVAAIAYAVGFADSRYFATRFRQALGLTPTRFRQRAREQLPVVPFVDGDQPATGSKTR